MSYTHDTFSSVTVARADALRILFRNCIGATDTWDVLDLWCQIMEY